MTDDDFADAVEADNSPVAKLLAAKDAEIERLRAALADRGEPPDWKLVPLEPTDAMRAAPAIDRPGFSGVVAREVYRAMLAAAPEVPR